MISIRQERDVTLSAVVVSIATVVSIAGLRPVKAAPQELWRLCASGKPQQALKACSRIISQPRRESPQSLAKAYTGLGYAYFRQQDYETAVSNYTMAIALDPRFTTAYVNRGVAYRKTGRLKRAIADYSMAIRLNPRSAAAYHARGIAYRHQRRYDKAIADYNRAIHIKPGYVTAYLSRGFAYAAKGDYNKAIANYQVLIDMGKNLVRANYETGRAYELQGMPDRAIRFYRHVLELPGRNKTDRKAKSLSRQRLSALASSPMPPGVSGKFGSDCRNLDLSTWRHPTRRVIASRKQAHLKWVQVCQNKSYRIFGVNFDYDVQGQTSDFFTPLYLDMLKANGGQPFSFIELSDGVIVNIKQSGRDEISIAFDSLSQDVGTNALSQNNSSPRVAPTTSSENETRTAGDNEFAKLRQGFEAALRELQNASKE